VKLSQSGRGAYVLRGRRLVGHVSTADILKKISGALMAGAASPRGQALQRGRGHSSQGAAAGDRRFKRAAEADRSSIAPAYLAWPTPSRSLDPAIEAYRKCIDIAPEYHKAFNNVGELYRRKGLLDYAAMVFKMATEIEPRSRITLHLGITYFEIGMDSQPGRFTKAVALDPNDYGTRRARAGPVTQKNTRAPSTRSRSSMRPIPSMRDPPRPAPASRCSPPPRPAQGRRPPATPGETRRVALEERRETQDQMVDPAIPPDRMTHLPEE